MYVQNAEAAKMLRLMLSRRAEDAIRKKVVKTGETG